MILLCAGDKINSGKMP